MAKIIHKLFDAENIPQDARNIIENFDKVIQGVFPANSKQLNLLPKQIRDLSHQMTDERGRRRLGYMNDKTFLAAYARYFLWWNIIRLTRLFANLDFSFLSDGDICLDIGSGPLTVITALWLARPELRQKKLTWYAMDISQQTLNFGEEIYLSVAAKTIGVEQAATVGAKMLGENIKSIESTNTDRGAGVEQPKGAEGAEPWKIIRVKEALGANIKQKAALVTCANVFNEILQGENAPPDALAKKYSKMLFSYLQEENAKSAILLIEPGVPNSARFVSLMRDAFLRQGFAINAPCPHAEKCPFDGRKLGKSGANGKWCNFAFETDTAPKRLLALSKQSGLPKERAVLSFVFATRGVEEQKVAEQTATASKTSTNRGATKPNTKELLRIASDTIFLPGKRRGYYACTAQGFALAVCKSKIEVSSGDLVQGGKITEQRDEKTNALIIEI